MRFSILLLLSIFLIFSFMATMALFFQPYAYSCSNSSILLMISSSFSSYGTGDYPGFNVSCKKVNRLLIQLGLSGECLVRDVNYINQEVEIYDKLNCVPRRLLGIDLSRTPFGGAHYETFTFYNCTSKYSSNVSKPLSCLSTPNHTIFATSNASATESFKKCDVIAYVMVPSKSSYQNGRLVWDTPDSKAGELHGRCVYKKKGNLEMECFIFLSPKEGFPKSSKFAIFSRIFFFTFFGVPILVCLILIAWCISETIRLYGSNNRRVEHVETMSLIITTMGLDESVIRSYPETVLGESLRLVNPDHNTCSICLSDYQAKEIIKTIPNCKHCFHSACVDKWLRLNVTCPICRNVSLPILNHA